MDDRQERDERVDVLIVTAVKDEWDAVLAVHTEAKPGSSWEVLPGATGLEVRYRDFVIDGGVLRIAVVQALSMGREQAVIAAAPVLTRHPEIRCLAMCGVCAGRRDDVSLGDVIVADRAWPYDAGKLKAIVDADGTRAERFQGDMELYRISPPDWKQRAERFQVDSASAWIKSRPRSYEAQGDWVLERINKNEDPVAHADRSTKCPDWSVVLKQLWKAKRLEDGKLTLTDAGTRYISRRLMLEPDGLSDAAPFKIAVGPIASGAPVVEDPTIFEQLSDTQAMRKVIGLEMETSAILALASIGRVPYAVVMKGVMDHADSFKSDNMKPFAAMASAECLIAFVRQNLPSASLESQSGSSPPRLAEAIAAAGRPNSPMVVTNTGIIGTQNITFTAQSLIQGTNVAIGEQHVHLGDTTSAQLEVIEALVEGGQFDRASSVLERLEKTHWSGMPSSQKHLHRKLQARILASQGERKKAASRYHEAADFTPGDEKSQALHAIAYFMEGQEAKAHVIAGDLVTRYPHLKEARAVWIRSSPKSTQVETLVPLPWSGLEPEIATALAERLLEDGRPDEAIDALEQVCSPGKRLEYFYILTGAYQAVIDRHLKGHQPVDKVHVSNTIKAADAALSLCKGEGLREARLQLLLTLATAHRLAGDLDKEWAALNTAYAIGPNEDAVQTRRANWLTEQKRYTEAIKALEEVMARGKLPAAPMLISLPLWKRNENDDRKRAKTLLSNVAENGHLEPVMRRDAVDFLIELSEREQDWAAVREVAQKYPSLLGEFRSSQVQALALLEEGNREAALAIAQAMYARRDDFSDVLPELGVLLQQCGANEEAFDILATRAPQDEWTNPTIALFQAARDTERFEFLIRLCRSLTNAGIVNPPIVDAETVALARRGENAAAIAVAERYLATHEHPFVRLRLSTLAIAGGRMDLVERDAKRLPQPTPGLGHAARLVVETLRSVGHNEEAIRFAYDNYRLNRSASEAWDAVIVSFMPVLGAVEHREPEIADGESAVRLREGDSSEWFVIESQDPDSSKNEYPATHPFARAILGHKVGDTISMGAKTYLPQRTYVVEEIRSKYVRCYQWCLDNWERQFPEIPGPQMILLPDNLEELEQTLLPMLAANSQRVEAAERYYATNECTLHLLARQLRGSVFAAMAHLVAETEIELRCAHSGSDVASLNALLDGKAKIIIHATAIGTLLLLGDISIWRTLGKRIAVARSTLDELRSYLREVKENPAGFLRLRDSHMVVETADDAHRTRYAEIVQAVVQAIEENCEVFAEVEHSLIEPAEWDAWSRAGGSGAAESLHRALREKEILWMDDATLSAFAGRKGVPAVWTQLTYDYLAHKNLVEASVNDETGARLLAWRYTPSRVSPGVFAAAARVAKWNPSSWPLSRALREFSIKPWPPKSTVALASHVLREWWRAAPTDASANAVTVALLDNVLSRADGRSVIAAIQAVLESVFGIDVLTCERADQSIRAWIKARIPRAMR